MNHFRQRGIMRRPGARNRRPAWAGLERLEDRALLASIAVDVGQVVRPVNAQILGVNLAWWDSNLPTTQTQQLVKSAGLTLFRFPGGSSSDEYHFSDPASYAGKLTVPDFAKFIESEGGQGLVTLDYGSGSPQEAAAFLAYLNAPVGNTTAIGVGAKWSDNSQSWVATDWKTAGYWASLRASTPLTRDDGLNFLRIGHAAPFAFHDYEVGNEVYGSWETDHHGQGGDTGKAHDPATYIAFAKSFATYAASIDPTISIGVDVGSVSQDNNWTPSILQQSAAQGFTPGFLSDHHYVQAPGQESDSNLLLNTGSSTGTQDPTNPENWAVRAADYRALLNQTLRSNAAGVQLLATEFNSVYSNPGKQTTSLVNGLFLADSLGSLLDTEYNGATVWDLRNSYDTSNNNSSSLYGWRQGGDYGLLGSGNGSAPATGVNTPYPTYFAEQLVSKMVHTGDTVVRATSNDPNLATYAVREANGHLDLLVINKSATSDLTGTFQVAGFQPGTSAQVYQYGKAQDTAQSQTTDGHAALASFVASLTPSGSGFSYTFPSYSMTVLDLGGGTSPGPTNQAPTIARAASATPSPVLGTTTTLTTLGADDGGEAALTYTWTTTGTPPAAVSFATNGTNAAKSDVVTFARAGTYAFSVKATDAGGLSATSAVTVVVNQSLTAVTVTPGSTSIGTGKTQQFAAQALDQFGATLATQPAFTWSVAGVGSIATTGLYTAAAAAGTATVKATTGSLAGSASVTITATAPPTQASFTTTYAITNDWGSGFTAQIVLTNTSTTTINGWTLAFDYTSPITAIWNAAIISQVGNHYVVGNVSYDATIAPGQSITIGFNANRIGTSTAPTGYLLNGVAAGPSTPTASGDLAASARYQVTSDWGSGFGGQVVIANTGTAGLSGWTLEFDFAANITQIWNATIVSHVGNHYVIRDAGYNGAIAAGQSTSFGFNAARGDGTTGPAINVFTNVILTSGTQKKTYATLGPAS